MRKHRQHRDPPDLDITAFLNLMVVLVPFLLITAVFSRITILQLDLPASASAEEVSKKEVKIEVMVRQARIDIGDGEQIVLRIPNLEQTPEALASENTKEQASASPYDIAKLSEVLLEIKRNYSSKLNATVLMEQNIRYEYLVQVMDAVSGTEMKQADGSLKKIELFPEISVGDAPGE